MTTAGLAAEPLSLAAPLSRSAGRSLFVRLAWVYQVGCAAALLVTLFLVALGLEFNGRQWLMMFEAMPLVVAIYTIADLFLLAHHVRPVGRVLQALDEGRTPEREEVGRALVRTLNLPYLAFLRVTFLHGPLVTLLVCLFMIVTDTWLHGGFALWQTLTFMATTMFFASPTHAIFEYFATSSVSTPIVVRLSREAGGALSAEQQAALLAVPLRSKLLYLAVFVATLPLVFFAVSIIFKIDRLLLANGLKVSAHLMAPLYAWVVGIVVICMLGSIVLALLTAREVSHSATELVKAMRRVESGRLEDVRLEVLSTDEYADIYRGFNLMLDALREEQRILAVSHGLSGELQLDVLVSRVMRATTELLNAERSTLFLHDRKSGELFSIFAEGETSREIRLPSNRGIAGAVFTSGEPENITDPYADPRFDDEVDRTTGFRTRSILCQPIVNHAGERIGVTQVLNKHGGHFSARDEARLAAFSAQIAVCLENATLFEDVVNIKNYNESILKSTSNGIITLDVGEQLVTANDAAVRLLERPREALVGSPASEIFSGANSWIADSLKGLEATAETQIAVDAEIVRPGGRAAAVNLMAAPLIDAADHWIGSMLVLEDITNEKRVRSTMARYMSKEVADQLLQSGEDELIGKDQVVSILFSDVRGFTSLAEAASARETVAMLNEYFTEMVDVVFSNRGILDKYIGDAIMALFGAPFAGPADADNALATANQMLLALGDLNRRRAGRDQAPLDIGLGINTGEVTVGNIGSAKRMEYTVIGDNVNLASRLEGANKFYGSKILVSEYTHAALTRPGLVREVDLIRVKGRDRPVAVYESLDYRSGELGTGLGELLERFGEGLAAYRAHAWDEAKTAFEAALAVMPGDAPSAIYLDRCERFLAEPPAADWNGAWILPGK